MKLPSGLSADDDAPGMREGEEALKLYKQAVSRLPTSIAVVTHQDHGSTRLEDFHGVTVGSFGVGSFDPPVMCFWLMQGSKLHQRLSTAEPPVVVAVSILGEHQRSISDHFAGKAQLPYQVLMQHMASIMGVTVVANSMMLIIGPVMQGVEIGDHTLVLMSPAVIHMQHHDDPELTRPLVHWRAEYHGLGPLPPVVLKDN